jgi:magnesium-transporting ATPase (P-type)
MRRTTVSDPPRVPWHTVDPEAVFEQLGTGPEGLPLDEVESRLERYGLNQLPQPRRRGPLARLADQFNNLLIYVLLGAALVTALLAHWVDTGVILGVVVINALIGFLQEGKAEKALDAIRGLLSPQATVIRAGRRQVLSAEHLVPGDVVVLQSGDKVPADLRLFRVRDLRIEEASLTGESVPVEKAATAVEPDAVLGDRSSMAYASTLVTYGQGAGVVVATGAGTEIGHISAMLGQVQTLTTPLLKQIAQFGRWLTAAILLLGGFTFLFGVLFRDYSATDMFLAAVGLVVAAIPEGLPAIITITLAIGVQRMARRNGIIRLLPAVETLGAVSVICSDKTGTLTRNEMTVQAVVTAGASYGVTGVGYDPHGAVVLDGRDQDPAEQPELNEIARAALLCNDAQVRERDGAWQLDGDPTEGALVTLALKCGLDADYQQLLPPCITTMPATASST